MSQELRILFQIVCSLLFVSLSEKNQLFTGLTVWGGLVVLY